MADSEASQSMSDAATAVEEIVGSQKDDNSKECGGYYVCWWLH